jgi:hypothetical protein
MCVDEPANDIQLSGAEAVVASQFDRFQPELARAVLSLDVYTRRLVAVEAGEEDRYGPGMPLILGIQGCPSIVGFVNQWYWAPGWRARPNASLTGAPLVGASG